MSKICNFHPIVGGAAIEGSHVSILSLIRNPDPDRLVLETTRTNAPKHSHGSQGPLSPGFLADALIEYTSSFACIAAAALHNVRSKCGLHHHGAKPTAVDDDRAGNGG